MVASGFKPKKPDIIGFELATSYEKMCEKSYYRDKSVFIIGKGNSGLECANDIINEANMIICGSPSSIQFAYQTHYVGNPRLVNSVCIENYQLKSLSAMLDCDILEIKKDSKGYIVRVKYIHAKGEIEDIRVDEVIYATGFTPNLFKISPDISMINKVWPNIDGEFMSKDIDDLYGIRDICDKYGTWFHLDAASGGVYGKILSNKYGSLRLADSITVDPSKWFFMSYGVGSLLVKNSDLLKELYGTNSSYWMDNDKHDNFQMSFNGTRSWRSLGLYLSFKYYGSERYISVINNMISVVRYLSGKLKELDMDLICGSELPIIIFRPKNYNNDQVEKLCDILIQEDIAYVTTAQVGKWTYIRVAISNYLTDFRHIGEFIIGLKNEI